MSTTQHLEPVTFMPRLAAGDECANYWMRQAMLRLRREVCWIWAQEDKGQNGKRPPLDRASEALELHRCWEDRNRFFQTDITGRYLTQQLQAEPPLPRTTPAQGSFSWVLRELGLEDSSAFVLGLSLLSALDSAAGSVISACHHDAARVLPSLGLVQKLWDQPEQVLWLGDAACPLFRLGLLKQRPTGMLLDWDASFAAPAMVARQLLFPASPPPESLIPLSQDGTGTELRGAARVLAYRLSSKAGALQVVPVHEPPGADGEKLLVEIAAVTGRSIYECDVAISPGAQESYVSSLATLCWLRGADLLLNAGADLHPGEKTAIEALLSELRSVPITIFLRMGEHAAPQPQGRHLLPALESEPLSYAERLRHWKSQLGESGAHLSPAIEECARRFRFGAGAIDVVCRGLKALPQPISEADLAAACRSEVKLNLGELVQPVAPRFENEELILPTAQQLQFQEVLNAMAAITEVHYRWGTAKAWNEAGISALFAGPPGTGKTMAAEVAALKLGLPMYRVDLSQVVNKYIGETEKNLKRVFDAADASDMVLFIDEAEAILGRRLETRDAHDRYANLEISYLLDRMERFKGLAILATNRKKDLDEAFLRRLRYIIEFPLPGPAQRIKLWRQCIPPAVDASQLDLDFLGRQFALAGGHIRSIVLNACLQSASREPQKDGAAGRLTMDRVLAAVKREYEKLGRSLTAQQCGPYAKALLDLPDGPANLN